MDMVGCACSWKLIHRTAINSETGAATAVTVARVTWRISVQNPIAELARMNRSSVIRQLDQRVEKIEFAPFIADDRARGACQEEWSYYLRHATWRESNAKKAFYRVRIVALVSSITVPALIGLNLSGSGGSAVRWLTFAFGLIAALATGLLALYGVTDRWLMYRQLMESLMAAGQALAVKASAESIAARALAWTEFDMATDKAIADYHSAYEKTVILGAQQSGKKPAGTQNG